jgi:hypothetical protein
MKVSGNKETPSVKTHKKTKHSEKVVLIPRDNEQDNKSAKNNR